MTFPIFVLKRQARRLARDKNLPLHRRSTSAQSQGFQAWSHLVSASSRRARPEPDIVTQPGELLLIGARPGQGKTLYGLTWAADAVRAGHQASIFSLEETEPAIRARFERLHRATR